MQHSSHAGHDARKSAQSQDAKHVAGAMGHAGGEGSRPYLRLLAMVVASYVAMYALMYAMVNTFGNVFNNINQVYMAALMAAPMVLIELALMAHMYRDRTRNILVAGIALLVMLGSWFGIREQIGVGDQQFLRSMIPHHAGALLMCEENRLKDPQLQQLCQDIIRSQQSEIELMKAKLR